MRILLINPNTTESMTRKIGAAAQSVSGRDTEVTAVNPAMGPVSIEGYHDQAFSVPGLLEEIGKGRAEGYDGYIIACFDDTGLDAARCVVPEPVLGICEAAMHVASFLGGRMSVVTTLKRSIATIEALAARYGVAHRCTVRAAEVPVLALEDRESDAVDRIRAEIRAAISEEQAETIVLGCAGMTDLTRALTEEFRVPVIDGVAAATKLMEALIGLGLKTSKVGGYAAPLPKTYLGDFARFSPKEN
ncbi:MAG: aspartate/glutamate racemase family protein [Gammaproteobacteria bacterium]|nr:aspartate/glutamate racemase family protein [Gammaproteobacteria bacterium]NIP87605.1 aspartate/glutamate racemase family protein [Gammaproteobacteria bacterium]NIR21930.1 aspartate/glutamate racemase family protein [Gammaproteobacteria bacterium]NIS03626.1 aspartate/glutamate racemase family protein [Gammaproteobacteria bacterium]NIU40640.1 aspartate/glutamate racemase family protein [Gammaproteobacteria bacterium]